MANLLMKMGGIERSSQPYDRVRGSDILFRVEGEGGLG